MWDAIILRQAAYYKKMNPSADFPCKKNAEEVSMSFSFKICLYHIKPPYSTSLSWIRMNTAKCGREGLVIME